MADNERLPRRLSWTGAIPAGSAFKLSDPRNALA